MRTSLCFYLAVGSLALSALACGSTPTDTPVVAAPTDTPRVAAPTDSPVAIAPTDTRVPPEATHLQTPTDTPIASPTPRPAPIITPTFSPTPTPTNTPTASPTPTLTPTDTPPPTTKPSCGTTLLNLGKGTGRRTTDTPCWFEVYVPPDYSLMVVHLQVYGGTFDLYLAPGRLGSQHGFLNADHELSFAGPIDSQGTFAFLEPSGEYTVALLPGSAAGAFELEVRAARSEGSAVEHVDQGGGLASASYGLTSSDAYDRVQIGSEFGARVIFPIEVGCPGKIVGEATWTGSAQRLALILNGPGQVGYYDRQDGQSPLAVDYMVTWNDLQQGKSWYVTLTNFEGGTAEGRLVITYPSTCPTDDCIPFDYQRAEVQRAGGRWKIVVGGMWLLDFGGSETEARRALQIIQHYRMDSQCFIGRPDPSMEYYLAAGVAPAGSIANEDCVHFNPAATEVKRVDGRWKIVEGSHWIMDFADKEGEARAASQVIKKHSFSHYCFVGRPDPPMTYFRR